MKNEPGPDARRDVRMRGFVRRTTVEDSLAWPDAQRRTMDSEVVILSAAAGRVLARDIDSKYNVPAFQRAMMDGCAVVASDTQGASAYNPLPLKLRGEVMPGRQPDVAVTSGAAVRIMTGAPMPAGADAVLPAEKIDWQDDVVYCHDEVPPGKNVGRVGEDIAQQATVLRAGRRLRPQDIGVLSSIGVGELDVVRKPRVRIVVTGNELLPPGSAPEMFRIVDANSPMLAALSARDGGLPIKPGIVPDDEDAVMAAM